MAPLRLMQAAAPGMAKRGRGRIVNICSTSGKRPSLRNAAYSVTKAAELSLSRAFRRRLRQAGGPRQRGRAGPGRRRLWLGKGGLAEQSAARAGEDPRAS